MLNQDLSAPLTTKIAQKKFIQWLFLDLGTPLLIEPSTQEVKQTKDKTAIEIATDESLNWISECIINTIKKGESAILKRMIFKQNILAPQNKNLYKNFLNGKNYLVEIASNQLKLDCLALLSCAGLKIDDSKLSHLNCEKLTSKKKSLLSTEHILMPKTVHTLIQHSHSPQLNSTSAQQSTATINKINTAYRALYAITEFKPIMDLIALASEGIDRLGENRDQKILHDLNLGSIYKTNLELYFETKQPTLGSMYFTKEQCYANTVGLECSSEGSLYIAFDNNMIEMQCNAPLSTRWFTMFAKKSMGTGACLTKKMIHKKNLRF